MTSQNMPWEDRPQGCKQPMWRFSQNPIIDRYQIPCSKTNINSAGLTYGD